MKKLIYISLFSILSLINSFSFSTDCWLPFSTTDWLDNKISAINLETGEKYILGKYSRKNFTDSIVLKKINRDGKLDLNFGRTIILPNLNFETAKINIEKDGKILIEVESKAKKEIITLYRIKLNKDGTPDTTLSIDCLTAIDPKTGDKYVLGKVKNCNLIYVLKQKPDTKEHDEEFNKNFALLPKFPHQATLDFNTANITIEDSKIIITINTIDPLGNIVMYEIKLNPDGTLDKSFGDKKNPGVKITEVTPTAPEKKD